MRGKGKGIHRTANENGRTKHDSKDAHAAAGGSRLGRVEDVEVKEASKSFPSCYIGYGMCGPTTLKVLPADAPSTASEVELLRYLKGHANVVCLERVVRVGSEVALIFEDFTSANWTNLRTLLLAAGESPRPGQALAIFAQVVWAISRCHELNVVHGDLKLQNFAYNMATGEVKLAELAGASLLDMQNGPSAAALRGSPAYVAPEVLRGEAHCRKAADVWSLGVVLHAMLCRTFPFLDRDPARLFQKIKEDMYVPPSFIDKDIRRLLCGMLNKNPEERLTLEKVQLRLAHVFGNRKKHQMWGLRGDGQSISPLSSKEAASDFQVVPDLGH